jgi:F-type H+-transporting ATPase subunit b
MELPGDIGGFLVVAAEAAGEDEGGSFLVEPVPGLMIWTLIAFGVTMYVLGKLAFPWIGRKLEERANSIRDAIDAAEKRNAEAERLLAEYRQRLTEAREQAEDIVTRARKAAEAAEAQAAADGRAKREELVSAARKDIETETRRSLERIRKEVADLTVLATEKVTRKTLTPEDHQRLIEEALSEVDFSALAGNGSGGRE